MDRNLNPSLITKEVIAARWLWGKRYSQQRGGQVDFYESLDDSEKTLCQELVDEILKCPLRSLAKISGR